MQHLFGFWLGRWVSFAMLACTPFPLLLLILDHRSMVANTSPSGPFNRADNGYFATWGCMLSSWYYM